MIWGITKGMQSSTTKIYNIYLTEDFYMLNTVSHDLRDTQRNAKFYYKDLQHLLSWRFLYVEYWIIETDQNVPCKTFTVKQKNTYWITQRIHAFKYRGAWLRTVLSQSLDTRLEFANLRFIVIFFSAEHLYLFALNYTILFENFTIHSKYFAKGMVCRWFFLN